MFIDTTSPHVKSYLHRLQSFVNHKQMQSHAQPSGCGGEDNGTGWSTGHLLVALQNQLMLVELQRQWVLVIPLWGTYLSGLWTLDTKMEKAGFC